MTMDKTMANNYDSMTAADKAIFINNSIAKHGGKMLNIPSISTSALVNEFCTSCNGCGLAATGKCYAKKYLKMRPTLAEKCARNTAFYTAVNLSDNDIPHINAAVARFESFGELENVQQFKNYCTIAWNNERCNFSMWTKRPEIIKEYDRNGGILPDNLNIILSSHAINKSDIDFYKSNYSGLFDAVFTVYTKEYAQKHNIKIDCIPGSGACMKCGKCYSKAIQGQEMEINELLK